jgi:hypothetical protein
MPVGSKITIVVLSAACLGFGVWYFISVRRNTKASQGQMLIPFSASIDPQTGTSTGFMTSAGEPQLLCPSGTSINIVGAFYDIADTFGECTNTPSNIISYMCNPSVSSPSGSCKSDGDCGSGMTCNTSAGTCSLAAQASGSSTQCPEGTTLVSIGGNYYCINNDICGGGIPNPVCSPSSGNQCAMRDATVSVGAKCNGRQACPDLAISDFGPTPCPSISPTSCISSFDTNGNPQWINPSRSGYCGLPYLPGWAGGAPYGNPTGTSSPANASIGYTMHGIYACVPNL